jgi:DNA-binding NarL/FixJ family response regulator
MSKATRTSNGTIRVLIADDYPFFRRGLRNFIEEQPDMVVVGEAGSASEVVDLCGEERPHIVLLDLDLDGADGIGLIGTLRDRFPEIQHVALITPDDEDVLADCVDYGVAGCIMKNADLPLMLHAIRTVSAGGCWLQREMTGKVFHELRRARRADRDERQVVLSDRETEVLKLLAEGLRNLDIAERLFISERTVKVHVGNIFSKLQVRDRVQATRYAIRSGMVHV